MPARKLSLAIATALAIACLPFAASAQDGQDDIVVTGEGAVEPNEVASLVQQLTDTHRADRPATRFFDALCLTVTGLNAAGNAWVKNRIEANARQVGLESQGEGCRANAVVMIHDDPAGLADRIAEEVPALLPRENLAGVRSQLAAGRQAIVWHNEEDRNQGGRRIGYQQAVAGDRGSGSSLNVVTRVNNNNWPSRSELAFSRGVVSAAMIVDGAVVEGMVIDRLADYATMRLLAPDLVPLQGAAPEPETITAPFPQEGGPEALTRFDLAYLTALYSLRPNAPAIRLARAVAEAYEGEE